MLRLIDYQAKIIFCLNENHCTKKIKIKNKSGKKLKLLKKYRDASMNRATPNDYVKIRLDHVSTTFYNETN